jgi:hypothetical protein
MEKEVLIKILETTDISKIRGFSVEYEDFSPDKKLKTLTYEE